MTRNSGTVYPFLLGTCLFLPTPLQCSRTRSLPDARLPHYRQPLERNHVVANQWTPARGQYAGAETCAKCHAGIAATQRTTPMFHAASRPSESELLHHHADLSFSESGYSYSLSSRPKGTELLIKDDTRTISAPVDWAFGSGEVHRLTC